MVHEKKRQSLSKAIEESAEAVRVILDEHYPKEPWVHQAVEVVKHSLQQAISELKGASFQENSRPGEGYKHPGRTRAELIRDLPPSIQNELKKAGVDWII